MADEILPMTVMTMLMLMIMAEGLEAERMAVVEAETV
jgi:hypothetical protein